MTSYQITLFNGHLLIKDGDNIILIDTGSPSTIHTSSHLTFCSKEYNCLNQAGLTVSQISGLLGTSITTLLGMDILSDYSILFDYKNGVVGFDKGIIGLDGNQTEVSNLMGVPTVEMSINNQNLSFFLDTGAKLSYLSGSITSNYAAIGKEQDFYPGIGNFTTDCYAIETTMGEYNFTVKYGNLPALLGMTLKLSGISGIIGFDFFNCFKVMLDFKNSTLKYTK